MLYELVVQAANVSEVCKRSLAEVEVLGSYPRTTIFLSNAS